MKELNLVQLDAQGLKCPLPVLRVRKYMKTLEIGEELEVLVTDLSAPEDFKLFCEQSGQEFVRTSQDGGVINIILRRMK